MLKVGIGFDAHRFEQGIPLILGGAEIPYEFGLKGHSDADVLTHAICDALLGAMGESDIGTHFPDTDPKYKGITSLNLLDSVNKLVKSSGFLITNIDTVIICEKPKLAPHIDKMKENISNTLNLSKEFIGIKTTTTEKMGFTGREEGIAANAIVLIKKL